MSDMKVVKRRPGRPPRANNKPKPVVDLDKKDKKKIARQLHAQGVANGYDLDARKPPLIATTNGGNNPPRNHIAELEERVRDRVDSWETESLFEDAIDGIAEESSFPDDGKQYYCYYYSHRQHHCCRCLFSHPLIRRLFIYLSFRLSAFLSLPTC